MNKRLLLVATCGALFIAGGTLAQAQRGGGSGGSSMTPGHEMQEKGSVPGHPGASGYAPGHTKDADDLKKGDRDDRTTGFGGRDRDDIRKGHDRDDLRKGVDRDDLRKKDLDDRKKGGMDED